MTAVERLTDPFGRSIDYLRVSVTDRCSLRCLYCLPPRGFAGHRSKDLLTDAEIVRIVSVAARLGAGKLRITGGEPLVRPGIVELAGELAAVPGVEDSALSTNGLLLSSMAEALRRAGVSRINVSLDTLRPDRFRSIARRGELRDVLDGVQAALNAGFNPVKINTVIMKGINSDEIEEFVSLTRRWPVHVRFIELMPIGETGFFSRERWLPMPEVKALCGALASLGPEASPRGFGPAVYFKAPGALGTVGFIGALSCGFCAGCNRLRLTSNGRLLPCLAGESGADLASCLRSGADDGRIAEVFREVVAMKPERHRMEPDAGKPREAFMCALGG